MKYDNKYFQIISIEKVKLTIFPESNIIFLSTQL